LICTAVKRSISQEGKNTGEGVRECDTEENFAARRSNAAG